MEISMSNYIPGENQVKRDLKEGTLAYIKEVTLPSESSTSTQGDQYTIPAGDHSSAGKDTENSDMLQEKQQKSSIQGLEDYSEEEINKYVRDFVKEQIMMSDADAEIVDIKVVGIGNHRSPQDVSEAEKQLSCLVGQLLRYFFDTFLKRFYKIGENENSQNPLFVEVSGVVREVPSRFELL